MGNAPSTPEVPGGGSDGYHVLKVADNSPGSRAGDHVVESVLRLGSKIMSNETGN